jgi:hypothetical protein
MTKSISIFPIKILSFMALNASALLVSSLSSNAQVVQNGDFSSNGADFTTSSAGQAGQGGNPATITDFTYSGSNDFGLGQPATSPFSPAPGTLDSSITYFAFIQYTGSLTGTVTGLTVGDTYDLTFDAGKREYDSGSSAAGSVSLTNAVSSDMTSNGYPDFSVPLTLTSGEGFVAFSDDFVATSTTAAITLAQNDSSGIDTTLNFANFKVTYASGPTNLPEPSTYALLGLGVLALVLISRRAATN